MSGDGVAGPAERGAGQAGEGTLGVSAQTAAALALSSGTAVSRSFRHHRPRGPFCGRGWCQGCPVAAGDGIGLACETAADVGRPRRVDVLRLAGRVGERLPPWFYEGRFLRPRWLRQPALRALRSLSAAHRLPAAAARTWPAGGGEIGCDTLVVGAGPSGLAAAAVLAAAGRRVAIVDAGPVGGTARWRPSLRSAAAVALDAVRAADALVLEGSTCIGIDVDGTIAVAGPGGLRTIRCRDLVVATGAYDRPLRYRGNDLPGTIGIRGFEAYAAQGALGGRTIGIFAGPAETERALAAARECGVRPAWVAGPGDLPAGAGGPARTRLVWVGGRRRVGSVELEGHGSRACRVLVLGFTQPSYELQALAGARLRFAGSPLVVTAEPGGDLPTLVVGEAAGWIDPALGAEAAAEAARAWLEGAPAPSAPAPAELPDPAVPDDRAYVCWCEDVLVRDVRAAVDQGFDHVELVKRRTGAVTGPCQGKLCLGPLAETLREAGLADALPTARPPVRPVPLGSLLGASGG